MNKKKIICLIIGIIALVASTLGTILVFVSFEKLGKTSAIVSGVGGILGNLITIISFINIKNISDSDDRESLLGFIDTDTFSYIAVLLMSLSIVTSILDEMIGVIASFAFLVISTFVYIEMKKLYGRDYYITPFCKFLTFLVAFI